MARHKPMIHMVPGANTAVLFLHGIVGTPDHFEKFIPLVPAEWSVYNILLDGHGASVKDFAKSSMRRWKKQVNTVVAKLLEKHEKILIVGHSMGTLFAIQTAIKYPQRIRHLFLLAAPLKIHPRTPAVITALKILLNKFSPTDRDTIEAKHSYGIEQDKNLLKYISWIPRYAELLKEIPNTRSLIDQIRVPCTVYQSRHDELVDLSSVDILRRNPKIRVIILPKSGHFFIKPCEEGLVLRDFQNICKQ
ncbi:MAG: alpha/beta fold hydrolase [Clostridia bacterium]|nr:alpha/beta fold hydrolase [Clostridia bacterium]